MKDVLREEVSRVWGPGGCPGSVRRRDGVGRTLGQGTWAESQFLSLVSSRRQSCCLYGARRERTNESELDTRLHRDKEFLSMS